MALEKALTFILFLFVGFLIRKKFGSKEQVNGIKNMILTIALPATIFVALMGVEVKASMLIYPLLALVFNFILYGLTPTCLKLFGIARDSAKGRSLALLLPSLAPGLSCFPFILEFLGEEQLANAALADVGNKVFVLIVLYMVAMNMYLRLQSGSSKGRSKQKIKSLLITLVKEPINMVISVAIILLILGIQFDSLPTFLGDTLTRMGAMMTPLVLLFIGLAVKIKKNQLTSIIGILTVRGGISLIISGALIMITGMTETASILLAVVFPLSSCSFWPFAHMAAFVIKESNKPNITRKTFDLDYAVLVLACSLPLSTMLILGIFSSGQLFTKPAPIFLLGGMLLAIGLIPSLVKRARLNLKLKLNNDLHSPVIKPAER